MDNNEAAVRAPQKKNKAGKIILGTVIFLLCAGLLFCYLNKVFTMGDADANRQTFKAFYAEPKNTIDVMYLGTSASNRYFVNPLAYEEEGITCFTLATMGMPMFFMPELIDEVHKTQDPQLYIIELRWVLKDKDHITDAHIRRVTDNLKLSGVKKRAIDIAFEEMDGYAGMLGDITDKKVDYYFTVIKYHDKLAQGELTRNDWKLTSSKNKTKGYVMSFNTTKRVNQFPGKISDRRAPLSDIAEDALKATLDKCDELTAQGKQVIFVLSPYCCLKGQKPIFNTAMDMVRERGYTALDFNTPEMYDELELDFNRDYYNSKHVNYIGAEKYTRYLTSYLKEHFDLPDHRGESGYESWEEAFAAYEEYVSGGIDTIGVKAYRGGPVTTIMLKGKKLSEEEQEELDIQKEEYEQYLQEMEEQALDEQK
ncbi:MAG: hypothetical protein ACSW8G_05300 [Bacillota bacterium]